MNDDTPPAAFKDRLRAIREGLRQMTQIELAKVAGLPSSSIAHFESGARKPSFDSLGKLATALNVTTDYLIGRVDGAGGAASDDPPRPVRCAAVGSRSRPCPGFHAHARGTHGTRTRRVIGRTSQRPAVGLSPREAPAPRTGRSSSVRGRPCGLSHPGGIVPGVADVNSEALDPRTGPECATAHGLGHRINARQGSVSRKRAF